MEHSASSIVRETLEKISEQGLESAPRGLRVRELELEHLVIDPNFPLTDFETRPFNFAYLMGELAWYLTRDNHIEFIQNFSSFWDKIADQGGHVNSNYGKLLFGDQLQWALDSLKRDPNTRQAISFVNQPKFQYEGNKDFVCTMYLNFWIRDNKLNMKVQMRSNDIFYGFSYDAPFFAFVQQTMWHWLRETYPDLELGMYHHFADNIHYYERHFNIAEQILAENPTRLPYWFHLREPLFNLNGGNLVVTSAGSNFMADVSNLINTQDKISQEESKETLKKYFFIQ
jgi:thymidylate synthase